MGGMTEPIRGAEIRVWRSNLRLSRAELAAELGCSAEHLGRIEREEKPLTPTMEKLVRRLMAERSEGASA